MSKNEPLTRGVPRDNWSTPYTAFNSMKYLMYKDYIESILKGDFKPPYMVDLDPSNICNYDDCIWCNSKTYRHEHPMMLSIEHMVKLADFLGEWGVRSACVSGGGEPMTNPGFSKLLYQLHKNNIKNGVITNGSLLDYDKAMAIADTSSWCGFSVDAASSKTFAMVHGVKTELFDTVIDNLKMLIELKKKYNSKIEITYKFLFHPGNAHEIYDAALFAKELGCNTFHLRPVCWDNLYNQSYREPITYSRDLINSINEQIELAQKLETNNYKFFGIRHKFNPDFTRKVSFKRCLATPMMTTFGADGNVHLCFDLRGKPDWILCSHYPNPSEILKVWGGEKHKRIIESIDPWECPRCTFGTLNEIIEQVFIEDKMFKDFL